MYIEFRCYEYMVNVSALEIYVQSESWDSVIGEYQDYTNLGCDAV